ncbi:MAG: uL15 family ribosomal protein [Candidatus Magasanikbacteria bacterium]|nr:uL15 family ribosomal protein [Candidatus Magasanikbacteria bacterium]
MLKNKPKIGGFRSLRPKLIAVNIDALERVFEPGQVITPNKLVEKNLIKSVWPGVKILGAGTITKRFNVVANAFSESAKKAIIQAGGKIQIIKIKK